MDKKNEHSGIYIPTWGIALALLVLLYLIYSPSFTSDYLMNDELKWIGVPRYPLNSFVVNFFAKGRSLFGIYHALIYNFVGYDPIKIQFIRFLHVASLATIALVLFYFLKRYSQSIYLSFFTILFFFSQLAFQGIIGYSLQIISNTLPAMWLSLCAFYLHFSFFPKRTIPKWIAYTIVFIIFMAAMQSTQNYAYFSMIPLSFLVLVKDKKYNKKVLIFFILALASLILSILSYKLGLEITDQEAYKMGEEGLTALRNSPLKILLTAINPKAYWSAYKIWTYPYPFNYVLPLGNLKTLMAEIVMVAWFILIVSAIVIELSQSKPEGKKQILVKWLWALICLGFGAFFIIADKPTEISDHRPHMTLIYTGVCIFTGAYAVQVLSSSSKIFNTAIVKIIGVFLVTFNAFGAQSSVLRGIVNIRENQINFIRTELSSKPSSLYQNIIVVLPSANFCISEPCDPWFEGDTPDGLWLGSVTHYQTHIAQEGRYKYALATLGIAPTSKQIIVVDNYPQQVAENELVIDWNKYVTAHQQHLNYLRER